MGSNEDSMIGFLRWDCEPGIVTSGNISTISEYTWFSVS
jgi:hypothetical protein